MRRAWSESDALWRLTKDAEAALRFLVTRRAVAASLQGAEVAIALLPNARLRELKRRYLRKDAPVVDVLSFPHSDEFPSPGRGKYLGEVYLNRTIIRRDPVRGRHLFIHGLLHLLGYRHDSKRDTMEMEKREKSILAFLENSEF